MHVTIFQLLPPFVDKATGMWGAVLHPQYSSWCVVSYHSLNPPPFYPVVSDRPPARYRETRMWLERVGRGDRVAMVNHKPIRTIPPTHTSESTGITPAPPVFGNVNGSTT